jgi:hypothetical protein
MHRLHGRHMATRIGNIYCVDVGEDKVRYFWDVGTDRTQLNSAVIVVFRCCCPKSTPPDLDKITSDEVDFYCHTMISLGKKLGCWSKAGFRPVTKSFPMLFRGSEDYGNPAVQVSNRWYVWEPNGSFRYVGRLTGINTSAEIGVVKNPVDVVTRICTGAYGHFFPGYE